MEQKRPSIPMQVQAFRRRRWRLSWPWVLAAVLVALLLIWLVSRYSGKSTPQTSTPVSVTQVAGPPWQMGNPEGRFTLTLYADLECPFCRSYFPVLAVGWPATRTWPCNGTTSRWPRMSRPRLPKRAWRSAPANLAAMPPSGRLSSGSMPTRAATARACPRTCGTPTYASHRAVSGERTARGADPHPDGGSHEQRRDRHAVAAAARSRNRQGDPTAGSDRGRCLAVGHGHARGRRSRRHTYYIGNACRRRRRHAQVAPVFKATAQSTALTETRSPRILAANDHRCRGDGCTLFVPQRACPPRARALRSHRLGFAMSFVVNDSCLESLSAIAAQHEDWIIQQAIALLEKRVSKRVRNSSTPRPCATTCA